MENQDRVAWVDYGKGFCIVMVVMMHSTLGVEQAAGATSFMGAVVAFAKPFRMPGFFLILGLFLARVIDRNWHHYLDRIALVATVAAITPLLLHQAVKDTRLRFLFRRPDWARPARRSARATPGLTCSHAIEPIGARHFGIWLEAPSSSHVLFRS